MNVNIVVEWVECLLIIGTGYWVQGLAWFSVAQSVCQWALSPLEIWFPRPWFRILHSSEEDKLSPFDSKIACLCQSIEINSNKHVYRQSQVRKPTDSGVEWAEYLQMIGTGCSVQVLSDPRLFSWFVSGHLVCGRFGSRDPGFESCIQQRKTTCLRSIRKSLACTRASKLTTYIPPVIWM